MKRIIILLSFILICSLSFSIQNATYGWEDGGTALGQYVSTLTLENSTEQAFGGTHSLKMTEDPLSGTPQAFIWWVTGLTDGDVITAGFYVYDVTESAYPSGRIWGHYTPPGGDINSYEGSASGNYDYSDGTGWSYLEWTWTFDSDGGLRDGLIVETRIYSSDGNNVLYVDNTSITVSSDTAEIDSIEEGEVPVELSSFSAAYSNGTPTLFWTTQSETNNIGWNVFRSESENVNESLQINPELIPGAGTTSQPTDYVFDDEYDIQDNQEYFYWLESIDNLGYTDTYGPISLTVPEDGEDPGTPEIPDLYGLHQNYPNPFNPNTRISYRMKEDCVGTLTVYNLKGEKMVILFENREIIADDKEFVEWNGLDNNGNEIPSGIYIYKLNTSAGSYSRKMVLAK